VSIRINRCVCVDRTFDDLLAEAKRGGYDVEQLMCESGAGNGCQLCRPYLCRAMETGQTEFHQIIVDEPAPR